MNFFKLYIGDYQRDTGTLTLAQHGAYMLMLQFYCATEMPLPKGKELYRLLRADSREERAAIDLIVSRYWLDTDDGLINERAKKEIDRAAKQRAINQETGKLGGRPRKTKSETEQETESVFESVSEPLPNRNPIQTPDSRLNPKSGCAASPTDPRKQLFDLGKTLLGAGSGGLISKAIAQTDEATVGAVLGEMAVKAKADPRAYFAKATQPKQRGVVV